MCLLSPMVAILVFQHVAGEHPGRFRDLWRADAIDWDLVAFDASDTIPARLDRYDAMVVMGGPMDVWQVGDNPWLAAEKQAIRDFVVGLRRPFLGICLGHQLLADALGGKVRPAARPEIGIAPVRLTEAGRADALFTGLADDFTTLQWHEAEVCALPAGAVTLAHSAGCAVQAFRWGAHAYGVQFHPEITADSITEFQEAAADQAWLETRLGPGAGARLVEELRAVLPELDATAQCLHRNFAKMLAADLTAGAPQA